MGRIFSYLLNVRFITILWAGYYACVFTVGRFEQWTQPIIWIGGSLLVLWTPFARGFKRRDIPNEALFIVVFLAWSLFGGIRAADQAAYVDYFKLCFEMLLVVVLMGAMVRKSGSWNIFWWTFIVVAVFNVVTIAITESFQIDMSARRMSGLMRNPNGLAFLCFTGILGTLALAGEKKSSFRVKAVAMGVAVVAFLGIIISGSRGAYLVFMLAAVLWPLMCVGSWRRHKWRSAFLVLIMVVGMCYVALWVQGNTTLGKRVEKVAEGGEGSATVRQDLILIGLEITKDHPLIGIGLGQFGLVSKTGLYAHSEWIELLATTGIPGFLFFMGIYISAWRRLTRTLKYTSDPIIRYRIKFAKMTLIILLVAGAVFRPNFLSIDTMFLIALIVGFSHWVKDAVKAEPVFLRHSSFFSKGGLLSRRDGAEIFGIKKDRTLNRRVV